MAFTVLPPEAADPASLDPISQAVEEAQFADMDEVERAKLESEQKVVKKLFTEYNQSREFDKPIRTQYAIDRRYAAGTNDPTWAVNTNLIGSFIDILVSFLYARNPDVTVKKAPQVDNRGSKDLDAFAKTMELVISRLWKKGALKKVARRQVRSGLSVGSGWFKAVLICDAPENPEMKNNLNDLRDNLERLEAVKAALAATQVDGATDQADTEIEQQNELIDSLENKIEATIRKFMAIDFVPAQNIQTSLDVACTEDYLDANWNADALYVLRDEVKQKFPRLNDEDVKSATTYYQRQVKDVQPLTDNVNIPFAMGGNVGPDDAEYYTAGVSSTGQQAGAADNGPEFVKVIELWDKRTNHIKTMIEGVKRWAKEPFQPPYASSRFYPYFRLAFYEVDGARHPQSLSWRLMKLQDEYARSRSSFRLTRERGVPGTLFNQSGMSPEDVQKITNGTQQEFIGITPVNADMPIQNLFAPKPVEKIDPRMFDNTPILQDMEKISGVQEALQSSAAPDKTATQANIEQSGFASRTTADRDFLEDMLDDFANYTGEVALGALNTMDAQRIAGPAAFWPEGMALDDRLTLIEIEIEAGSTGKPGEDGDQQAWGVILPVLKEAIMTINEAVKMGDIPLAKILSELVRETMSIMGVTTDPERFLPPIPEMPDPLIAAVTGGVPGAPGSVAPVGGAPSLPPSAGPADGGSLSNPELSAPNLQPPSL
jgi:hypothetical protein